MQIRYPSRLTNIKLYFTRSSVSSDRISLAVLDVDQGQGEDDGSESQLHFDAFSEEDLNLSEIFLCDVIDVMSCLGGLLTRVLGRLDCQEQWRLCFYIPSLTLPPVQPINILMRLVIAYLSSAVESNATFINIILIARAVRLLPSYDIIKRQARLSIA